MPGSISIQDLTSVEWQMANPDSYVVPQINSVAVWRVQISTNLRLIPTLSAAFTEAEKLRSSKYHQERDRQRFVVSRGALRVILGRYLSVHPAKIEFALTADKKPYIIANNRPGLQFNLSHSGDWVLLAVSQHEAGSDVEYLDPDFDFDELLPNHFSNEEAAYINSAKPTEKFYQLWTRKEAFLKATGQGLGEHLKQTPALNGEHLFPAALTGNGFHWHTASFTIADHYTGSVTVKTNQPQFKFLEFDF